MSYLLQQSLTQHSHTQPNKVAVKYKDSSLTYSELDTISNQLGHFLQQTGVKQGDRVGIYLDKSVEAVAVIFGILKAGAAYVPLDPGAPAKRIAFIIENCDMKALVTIQRRARGLNKALTNSPLGTTLFLDGTELKEGSQVADSQSVLWPEILQWPDTTLPTISTIEDDLAYILYTSGSTGDPKGVMISHRTSLTFVNWAHDRFQLRTDDRVSNHAPFHFDLSIFDMFSTIKAGATVILVPKQLSVFPRTMADFIEDEQITVWYSVPSVLTRLVLYGELERFEFSSLRTVLFAGEVFPIKYLRQIVEAWSHVEFYNLYGPTETNVCTYYKVPPISPERTEPLSIGRGCENTAVFAVNNEGKLTGVGEVGELLVRGPGVMQGYWGLPERTAKSLITDPIHTLWDSKAYRTGDLVRLEADGNYTFLGRRDHQIKSRGYRIELGEIETALYSHSEVEEAVAIAIPDDEIGNRIKALVVLKGESSLTNRHLEKHCANYVPRYMLPGEIEFRASLPKTSTGKVDRTSLVKEHL